MTDPVTGSAARCPDCGQAAEHHVAALCRLQAPGQERRAEPLTTSAAERTTQHDPGRVVPGSAATGEPESGATGVCRTCCQLIWWEIGQVGHRERTGWSDRIKQGGDSLVCFKAVEYRHVPLEGRELAIYKAGYRQAVEDNA